jgi:SAM-dependent methyltransferase
MAGSLDCCPVCRAPAERPFAELRDVPVFCNVLWPTREEAVAAPRGDVALTCCGGCGMVWNAAFDAALVEYAPAYENSLHFSGVFREYARGLAHRLVETYDVRGKDVVDIGSGKGEFLALVCELGGNRGLGFDPSYDGDAVVHAGRGEMRFVRELYSDAQAGVSADLVCCRHVLEHVPDPAQLLGTVRRALDAHPGAVVYFEVPAAEFVLGGSVWDVIYEHCSLFSAPSLRRLFEEAAFEVLAQGFSFGDQYLWVEARPAGAARVSSVSADELTRVRRLASSFDERLRVTLERARRQLAEAAGRGPIAVWGAGSKGVTFLNLAGAPAEGGSTSVVDVNPRKQGKHVPGTGHRVVAPEELGRARPGVVLAMNPLYRDEIGNTLERLGVAAEVVPIDAEVITV